jgi:ABC-type sugar transport system, permease component
LRKRTFEDYSIDTIVYALLIVIFIVTAYPFYYLFVISFNNGLDTGLGGIYFWPRDFTLANYEKIMGDAKWTLAFFVTVARTGVGTLLGVVFTCLVSYGLAHKGLVFKKVYFSLFVIGMYVSGGLIPFYIILRHLHLLNTFWVYVIPSMLNIFFLFIAVSFFREIPSELREAATIDGANDLKIFRSVILPISKPLMATMALFLGVGQWNAWLDSAYYVQNENLRTLTYRMIEVINRGNIPTDAVSIEYAANAVRVTTYSLQVTSMVVAVVPIMLVYPFLQKYFVKGAMIGAVKG